MLKINLPGLLLLLALSSLSCQKDEVPLQSSFTSLFIEPKEVDTTFNTLEELMTYASSLDTVTSFLSQNQWKTSYDRIFTISPNSDTLYQRFNILGKNWVFNFGSQENRGFIEVIAPNSSYFYPVTIGSMSFILNQTDQYGISEVAFNKDSTFSFVLQYSEMLDSLQRRSIIKLQSF